MSWLPHVALPWSASAFGGGCSGCGASQSRGRSRVTHCRCCVTKSTSLTSNTWSMLRSPRSCAQPPAPRGRARARRPRESRRSAGAVGSRRAAARARPPPPPVLVRLAGNTLAVLHRIVDRDRCAPDQINRATELCQARCDGPLIRSSPWCSDELPRRVLLPCSQRNVARLCPPPRPGSQT